MTKRILKWGGGLLLLAVLLAAVLLLSLWRTDLPLAYLEEKYAPPPSQFLELSEDIRVHYRERGAADAPALVLLHGSSSSLHTWEAWAQALGASYRVLSLDLPGHGLTGPVPGYDDTAAGMAELVHAFLRARNLSAAVLVGNSMGARVALHHAQSYPQATSALILISGGIRTDPNERGVGLFRFVGNPVGRAILTRILPRSGVADTLRRSVAEPEGFVTEPMIDRYYELLRRPGNRAAGARRFAAQAKAADPSAIFTPALLLWGEQDRLVPVKYAARLNALLPRSELIIYPNVGHLAMEEIPQKSARDARDFLVRVLP